MHLRDAGSGPVGPPSLQQALFLLDGPQDEFALRLVHHARAVELPDKLLLLLEDGHRRAVGLDGFESGGGFDLPVDDELPDLLALQLRLQWKGPVFWCATALWQCLGGRRRF